MKLKDLLHLILICRVNVILYIKVIRDNYYIMGKLPLAPMNYRVSSICPHELPSAILDPLKLPNHSQQPISVSQFR
jgi:hypothetical protein